MGPQGTNAAFVCCLRDHGSKQLPHPEGQPLVEDIPEVAVEGKRHWGSPALRQVTLSTT
jgi:hypothetical protein